MPGKRRLAPSALSYRQRLGAGVAAVVLLIVGVGFWAALGKKTDPLLLVPAQPIFPVGSDTSDTPPPPGSDGVVTPSAEPGPADDEEPGEQRGDQGGKGGGRTTPPVRQPPPVAKPPAQKPPPADKTPPPPDATAGPFTSRYTLVENGSRTFHARVFLTNRGSTTRNWSVEITYAASDRVIVGRTLGALKRTSGDTIVFSGFNARPGQTEIFGFDAAKGVSGAVRPVVCRVDGRDCDIRVG
jgi:hypothetical protein